MSSLIIYDSKHFIFWKILCFSFKFQKVNFLKKLATLEMAFFDTLSRGFVYFDAGIGISDLENIYLDTQHAQKDPFLRISGSLQGVT